MFVAGLFRSFSKMIYDSSLDFILWQPEWRWMRLVWVWRKKLKSSEWTRPGVEEERTVGDKYPSNNWYTRPFWHNQVVRFWSLPDLQSFYNAQGGQTNSDMQHHIIITSPSWAVFSGSIFGTTWLSSALYSSSFFEVREHVSDPTLTTTSECACDNEERDSGSNILPVITAARPATVFQHIKGASTMSSKQ